VHSKPGMMASATVPGILGQVLQCGQPRHRPPLQCNQRGVAVLEHATHLPHSATFHVKAAHSIQPCGEVTMAEEALVTTVAAMATQCLLVAAMATMDVAHPVIDGTPQTVLTFATQLSRSVGMMPR